MSDLVGNPEDRFSHVAAHMSIYHLLYILSIYREIDNDAYCVCTHEFSLCTHKKFRHVRTKYAVKISGTQTVFGFMHTQINTF